MAIDAANTILSVQVGSSYIPVAEVTNLSGASLSVPEVDTSHLNSTKATSRPGVPDAGSVSGTVWFDPDDSSHDDLFDLWDSPTTENWRIAYSTGATSDFAGYLTELNPDFGSLNDNVSASFTIRISGGVTNTAA